PRGSHRALRHSFPANRGPMNRCASLTGFGLVTTLLLATSYACSSGSGASGVSDGGADARDRDDASDLADGADEEVTGPALLSQTGLYEDFAARRLASDLLAFEPRLSFWADGAEKSRWIRIPSGKKIDTSKMDQWVFPVGTQVFKEFRVGGKPIETRLLM